MHIQQHGQCLNYKQTTGGRKVIECDGLKDRDDLKDGEGLPLRNFALLKCYPI